LRLKVKNALAERALNLDVPLLFKIFTMIHGRYPPGIMIKKLKKVTWAFLKVNCPSFQNTHRGGHSSNACLWILTLSQIVECFMKCG
jgi:lipid-binding SYLF domain-containing protein